MGLECEVVKVVTVATSSDTKGMSREPEGELYTVVNTVVSMVSLVGLEADLVDSGSDSSVDLKDLIVVRDLEGGLVNVSEHRSERLELSDVVAFDVLSVSSHVSELDTKDVLGVVLNF